MDASAHRMQAHLSNQCVDAGILPKFRNARSHHDQLAPVGDGHPRPVDALVSQPRRLVVIAVEKHHRLPNIFVFVFGFSAAK